MHSLAEAPATTRYPSAEQATVLQYPPGAPIAVQVAPEFVEV
jgi:hypothetical protein